MSDNDNRRPRRRAARSAGPPVDEPTQATVSIRKDDAEVTEVVAAAAAPAETVPVADKAVPADVVAAAADKTVVLPVADETVVLDKAAVAAESDADLDDDGADAATPTGRGRILALAAAVVLVLALVVGAGFAAFAVRSVDADEDLRAEYTQTARQAVINLTTIRADSAKEDIDRILSVASGEFKTEFDGRLDPFMDVVKQAKVVSHGEVVESGIESADDTTAKVLVAAKQTVSNSGSAEPQQRQYRFRVTVTKGDTGMTVSKVEFVG
ncbi:Mce protein [Nocardia sp. NPDC050718]|uniref:Mce protein n=1 Tax=Nocardia sp. NPDC050718 TaxID=3155788 RepID=UPI0034046E7C